MRRQFNRPGSSLDQVIGTAIIDSFDRAVSRAAVGTTVRAFMPVAGDPPSTVPTIQWTLDGDDLPGANGVALLVPDEPGVLSWYGVDSSGALVAVANGVTIAQAVVAPQVPVITLETAPTSAGLAPVTAGENLAAVLGRLTQTGLATTTGTGGVTTVATLLSGGDGVTDLTEGLTLDTLRFTYSASGAEDLVEDVAINIAVDVAPVIPAGDRVDVLIGSIATIDASGGTSGSYVADNLPRGATINELTGQITYAAMLPDAPRTVSVTRGGQEVQSIEIVPLYDMGHSESYMDFDLFSPHVDGVEAAGLWASDATITSTGQLLSAVTSAYADKGTADAPKYHRITYSGTDLGRYEHIARFDATAAEPGGEYTFIVIDFANQMFGQWSWRFRSAYLTIANATIIGDPAQSGGGSRPILAAANVLGFWNCRIGPHFDNLLSIDNNGTRYDFETFQEFAVSMIGANEVVAHFCHMAGWYSGGFVESRNGSIALIGNMFSHYGEDVARHFNMTSTDVVNSVHIGNVVDRAMMSGNNGPHPDLMIQTGGMLSDGWTINHRSVGNVVLAGTALYGSTGIRAQREGRPNEPLSNGFMKFTTIDDFIAVSGFDGIVMSDGANQDYVIEGAVIAPAMGIGAPRTGVDAITQSSSSILASRIEPPTGTDLRIYAMTEAGIEATFPNMTGANKTYANIFEVNNRTLYVPDFQTTALHPAAIRAMVADFYMPSTGWDMMHAAPDAVFSFADQWGAAPVESAPTVSLTDSDELSLTVTASEDGVVYYLIDQLAEAPTVPLLMQGASHDGTFILRSGTPRPTPSTVVDWGRRHVTAGANVIDVATSINLLPTAALDAGTYQVHLFMEDGDGVGSAVTTTEINVGGAALFDFHDPANFAPGMTTDGTSVVWTNTGRGPQVAGWLAPDFFAANVGKSFELTVDLTVSDTTDDGEFQTTQSNGFGTQLNNRTVLGVNQATAGVPRTLTFPITVAASDARFNIRIYNATVNNVLTFSNITFTEVV